MARSNRRKRIDDAIAVASTGTSGNTNDCPHAENFERVTYYIVVSTATAGSITFKIQVSPNEGATWHDLATAEMTGDTGAITATGNYHVSSNAPVGFRTRLAYTIVTGPFAFVSYFMGEKPGNVF